MKYMYHVDVAPGIHYDCTAEAELELAKGDEVIVRCERYQDFGVIVGINKEAPVEEQKSPRRDRRNPRSRPLQGQKVPSVIRRATDADRTKANDNRTRADVALTRAINKVQEHRLDMKIISSHYSFDKSMIVFQFSAEDRIDFRELLRNLSQILQTHVELRQVGVRDEAALQGGIGCCGRPFCCATFLQDFVSINVKMAKEQGLSLNPINISGACGRLKCCLRYESEGYAELNRKLPRQGSVCRTPEGEGKIVERNALLQQVRVRLDGDQSKYIVCEAGDVEPLETPRQKSEQRGRQNDRQRRN